ncbi:MAG: hypothetical protein NT153_01220 [Bacteroidetes bacterium]|nr:hypothetical protein [Bacteroidota bacterium]
MESVGSLIDKLKEQFIQEAENAHLLATTQLLLAELQLQQKNQIPKVLSNARSKKDDLTGWLFDFAEEIKNTETVPAISAVPNLSNEIVAEEVSENENEVNKLVYQEVNSIEPILDEEAIENISTPINQEASSIIDFTEAEESPRLSVIPDNEVLSKSIYLPEVSDLITEGQTTKAPIKEVFELNDVLHEGLPSLNDQLKPNNIALSDTFHKESITDLNKAIVLNDRYVFINELFRGDEVMYERSLKTINGFTTLLEAQSWIQRELKVKLGWNESASIVAQFDQLINRRFS